MFFGLTNSPATFQTMMDDIFKDLISEGMVVVYLDDILIFTETLEEHRNVIHRVLELLEKHKLYLRPDKCEFEKTTVKYLGVMLRNGFGTGAGCGRSVGKERKRIGRASERTGSRRTWLQLVRCALVHTGVLFRKADQTEKETGGTEVDIQTGDTGGNT